MRRTIRSISVLFVAMLGAIGLVIGSAFSAALAYGAIALIVPGTGTPDPANVTNYLQQARDRYLTATACGPKGGTGCQGADLQGVPYPATFFPLFVFNNWCTPSRCNTWDDSVGQGTEQLNEQLDAALENTTEQIVVFGYSQGGAVVADSLANHIAGLSADDKKRIQIVTIGGIENPNGGLWQRLNFLPFLSYIPFLNISLNPPMLPDTGVNYTSIGFQYDPVVNAPKYFGNAFALVNALAAFENVHGYYLSPNGNDGTTPTTLPYGYTDTTLAAAIDCSGGNNPNCKSDKYGNTYVTIPAPTLPIYNLLLGLTPSALLPIVKPLVNLLTPVTRLLIDLGYDTTGDPSIPTPLSLLPVNPDTFNPINFSIQFVNAIVQGIKDAINGGPTATVVPATTTSTLAVSKVAAKSIAPQASAAAAAAEVTGDPATVTDLAAKKDATDTAATDVKDPVKTDTTPVTVTDPVTTTPDATKSTTTPLATDTTATAEADKIAADKAAADKIAADKAAADKAAADKIAADKAAADKIAADKAKDAADKAAKDAATAATDKAAKGAADKAKESAAANGAAGTGDAKAGAEATEGAATKDGADAAKDGATGDSEKKAA